MRETIHPFFNTTTPTDWKPSFYLCDQNDNSPLLTKIENAAEPRMTEPEKHPALDLTPASSISIHGCSTPGSLEDEPQGVFQSNQFCIKKRIGSGPCSQVYVAQNKQDSRLYAIKAIDKQAMVSEAQRRHVRDEKHVLATTDHPHLVKLWGTFQNNQHLFLVTEYLAGGELSRLLRTHQKFSEDQARFYAAQVFLAIEYLHQQDIVYRDLKPENIVLDSYGHVKLIDFGFSKVLNDITLTLCGTPDYIAPEIIRARGYTKDVDWWSFGVLLFEMLTGLTPFSAENPLELYENILLCDIQWTGSLSLSARDLITSLLQTKPKDRIQPNAIKTHPWFAGLSFDHLSTLTAPFIPNPPLLSFPNQDSFALF
ncbi:kinase-like domain-containing protein [Sporodiniella umbellata]|nr:kinase-like domain-containing protein [Sporodiniella umbellata]